MPMGIFGVAAAVPFEVVWIDIPPSPTAASGILVDNLVVTRVPRLSIAPAPAGGVRVSWPDPSGGYLLESSPSVAPVSWVPEPGAIETSGGLRIQTVPAGSGPRFFRLRRP
jgi:hypothetical protein